MEGQNTDSVQLTSKQEAHVIVSELQPPGTIPRSVPIAPLTIPRDFLSS